MERHSPPRIVLALAGVVTVAAFADEPPTPTPTPASLADYARRLTLRGTTFDEEGRITIDNDTVQAIGRDRALVLGVAGYPALATPRPQAKESAVRKKWRSRYDAQQRRIAGVERVLEAVGRDIDRLNHQRLTPRVLARLEEARAKRAALERDLKRQRVELARLIRAARQEGAEPGWFR
jgi:hypothetical protein